MAINFLKTATKKEITQEAENINLKGTIPVKFKDFKVSGNSKQETSDTMPSPEYPSEIQNVEGDVNVTVANKNLFTELVKGISINHTTGEEEKKNNSSASDFIKVNFYTNTGYYLSGLTNTLSSYVAFYNKDKKYLGRTGGFEQLFIYFSANSFSSMAPDYENIEDKNITFVRITQYVTAVSPGTIDDIDNLQIQLEPGTTATNYVEHQEQTVTFPLSEGQKLYKGDYLADDGIHHVRKQVEFDGTETWTTTDSQNTDNTFYLATTAVDETISREIDTVLSNIAIQGLVWSSDEGNLVDNTQMYIALRFRFWKEDFSSVEGWKSYLAQQKEAGTPVIVEYVLAEEEIEAYTEEQQEAYNQLKQLTAYEEETNIYSTNEVSPVFYVSTGKEIKYFNFNNEGDNKIIKFIDNKKLNLQSKIATPSTSQQEITPDEGYNALTSVTVKAVDNTIDSNIQASNIKKDVSILGVTGTVDTIDNYISVPEDESLTINKLFTSFPLIDTSNITNMNSMFSNCSNLTDIPQLNTSKVNDMSSMFFNCSSLTTIPELNTSNVINMTNMFSGCTNLSNETLNNILQMLINATSYTGTKTLKYIGLSEEQAQICTILSNYTAFTEASWTTGY